MYRLWTDNISIGRFIYSLLRWVRLKNENMEGKEWNWGLIDAKKKGDKFYKFKKK